MGEEPTYHVHWSRPALHDLRDLCSYIANDDPDVAERFGLALLERVKSLSDYPRMGSPVPERSEPNLR